MLWHIWASHLGPVLFLTFSNTKKVLFMKMIEMTKGVLCIQVFLGLFLFWVKFPARSGVTEDATRGTLRWGPGFLARLHF